VHHNGIIRVAASWSNSTPVILTTVFPPAGIDDVVEDVAEPGLANTCDLQLDFQNHAIVPGGMKVDPNYNPKMAASLAAASKHAR